MSASEAFLIAIAAYWWGEWVAERRARKAGKNRDVCFELIYRMMQSVLDKRKLVGRYLTITSTERFTCLGERFALTLESEGDPNAYETGVREGNNGKA
jgi:hypothetical protein